VFSVFWAMGDLDDEQALSLLIGTALAAILSGATAYGSGVNVGLRGRAAEPRGQGGPLAARLIRAG
jgi:hypothetical protein